MPHPVEKWPSLRSSPALKGHRTEISLLTAILPRGAGKDL